MPPKKKPASPPTRTTMTRAKRSFSYTSSEDEESTEPSSEVMTPDDGIGPVVKRAKPSGKVGGPAAQLATKPAAKVPHERGMSRLVSWETLSPEQRNYVKMFKSNYQPRISRTVLGLASDSTLVLHESQRCTLCSDRTMDIPCLISTSPVESGQWFKCVGCTNDEDNILCSFVNLKPHEIEPWIQDLQEMPQAEKDVIQESARQMLEDSRRWLEKGTRPRRRLKSKSAKQRGVSPPPDLRSLKLVEREITHDSSYQPNPPLTPTTVKYWVAKAGPSTSSKKGGGSDHDAPSGSGT